MYTNHNVLLEIIDPAAIALAKKEKEDKELAAKAAITQEVVNKVVEPAVTGEVAAAAPVVETPKDDVIPTGY